MSDLTVYTCEQGGTEWLKARLGIPTASNFATCMAKGRGGADSTTRRTYMLKLAGELLTGEPAQSFGNAHTERGHAMEPDARNLYAMLRDCEPELVGFMRRGNAGASPDSLIGQDGLLEIKTKLPHLQLEVLLRDQLPAEHKAQVQGQLWISGRQFCDFVSYWPGLPVFITRVERDEEYIGQLSAAVSEFWDEMQQTIQQIRSKAA